jgi:hypothetical protein
MEYIAQAAFSAEPKFLLVLALVALVLLFVLSSNSARRRDASAATAVHKRCPGCRAEHPGFARFCRKCGTKLPE